MDDARPAAAAGPGRQAGGQGPDRLPLPGRRAPGSYVQGRLELHRRRLPDGCRRLLPLPVAHRRHDHLGRLQHRRARGRGRAAAAPRRGRMRGGRRGRRRARPDRQGLRRAEATGAAAPRHWCAALQDFVKQTIAPYKYPRAIEFRDKLPRTETGKLQRFRAAAAESRSHGHRAPLRTAAAHPLRALRPGRHRLLPAVPGDDQQPGRGLGRRRPGRALCRAAGPAPHRHAHGQPAVRVHRRQPHGRRRDAGPDGGAHRRASRSRCRSAAAAATSSACACARCWSSPTGHPPRDRHPGRPARGDRALPQRRT